MTYREAIDFLFTSLPVFEDKGAAAYKPGLERVAAFAAALGNPHEGFASVHIAGTNGKGSTAHMLAAVLREAGYRTGLYTSPHLLDFRERIRTDGRMIPEQAVTDFTERHKDEMVRSGMTFFEMATAMALDWFAREGVEIAVVETGLGGRLDATNILTPVVSVITNIGLEHTQYLGGTVAEIAAEKAGIIKRGVPVVIGETDPKSAPVFAAKAAECGSPLVLADAEYAVERLSAGEFAVRWRGGGERRFGLDLAGNCQRKNLAAVLSAVDAVRGTGRFAITEEALRRGLLHAARTTGLAGRWQVASERPLTVLDTAHNAHGMAQVVEQIAAQRYRRLHMVLGFAADKDLDAIIPLLPRGAHYILTRACVGRAMPVDELRGRFATAGIEAETAPNVAEAVGKAREAASDDDMIFIGGSNFTVAEAMQIINESRNADGELMRNLSNTLPSRHSRTPKRCK